MTFVNGLDEINENLSSLYLALAIAVMGVLFVILVQFSSIKDAVAILTSIPLGLFGVAGALWLFEQTLSMNALLGIILLAGIAVNNSIIFLDFFKGALGKEPNQSIGDLVIETAAVRFRPIVITTLTTIIGMLPIAIGLGEGGDVLRSLGLAVVMGLGWSTLCTMLAVPVLLNMIYKTKKGVK
ncbi:efflux RND transporter permease subunit [bacterium]|nr:efflux RND transporter permease subunit [bacterium]